MILDPYYSLRRNFSIIGLTGRTASGCSNVAELLSGDELFDKLKIEYETTEHEVVKQCICNKFMKHNRWIPYTTLKYSDVLLLELFHESFYGQINIENGSYVLRELIDGLNFIYEGGVPLQRKTERLNSGRAHGCFESIHQLITRNKNIFIFLQTFDSACKKSVISSESFHIFFFTEFQVFINEFLEILNKESYFLRCLLMHDLATSLRGRGTVKNIPDGSPNIFVVVEKLNWILKNHKNFGHKKDHRYIIDSLKNSLELNYFKEKYSAFYMVSVNRFDDERLEHLAAKIDKYLPGQKGKIDIDFRKMTDLDEAEYRSKDVNSGKFSSPDIENCIQKSDYHIFFSEVKGGKYDQLYSEEIKEYLSLDNNYNTLDLKSQITKLLSLIFNPGIVTPSSQERLMQVAFTAKLSSGCISRQVGAIVTDENFSVKAIGWNDVAEGQLPCNLRDFRDLRDGRNSSHFSDFELNDGSGKHLNYNDTLGFKDKIVDRYSLAGDLDAKLEGKPCNFCFKSCHNTFENKDNQVHTRSLHAEENAMLQISKYGGQSLKGGFLFTTASPCELCAKKAFQLGLRKIFYIDPYPGISRFHTLRNGVLQDHNPELIMYQGAIGRGYLRLYQPFMSYKDELSISTGVRF